MHTLTQPLVPPRSTRLRPNHQRFMAEFRQLWWTLAASPPCLEVRATDRVPCRNDRTGITPSSARFVNHPAWAARIIAKTRPSKHIDVGSTLTFCTIASAIVPMEFYDIRPAQLTLANLECKSGDLTKLPFLKASIASLSCMHVVEHVGLGRYGDPLDPDGDLTAIAELKRILAKGGSLLLVTPVGRPTLRFNAHRIYSAERIASYFEGLTIMEFSLIDDQGKFTTNADPSEADRQLYGCGCWWFTK